MLTKNRLLILSRVLGKVPSMGYAFIYLSFIPIFALIYNGLPKHFFHSTLQYEYSTSRSFSDIQEGLSTYFLQPFQRKYYVDSAIFYAPAGDLEVRPERFENLKIENEQVSVELFIYASSSNHPPRGTPIIEPSYSAALPLNITFDIGIPRSFGIKNGVNYESKLVGVRFETEHELFKNYIRRIAVKRAIFLDANFDGEDMFMDIPHELIDQMRNYSTGSKGFGSAIEGNFVRMLYLSASTITTLGFGDIVPITTKARLLISIEAILGIVLIGLFLNALSFERARSEAKDIAKN